MVLEVVACCFLDAGSVAAFDTSLWKLEKPKLVQEVKLHFAVMVGVKLPVLSVEKLEGLYGSWRIEGEVRRRGVLTNEGLCLLLIERAMMKIVEVGLEDVVRGTALIDVYVKCGFLGEAMDIFERMKSKDVKSWTAVISGHGIHEQPMEAIRLYKRMDNERFRPNEVTFLAILTAGMLHEAFELIKSLPIKGDATSWRTLLSACRVQGDVKLGNV
ncbi:hypothetical protein KIW84_013403 [Lathyrus oleraceus]|uniref:Pentatricopeptide repeat-containing protein n=1 Tax=Pisum sativum TaxID=3888 RepID=A0A9D5BK72_PEA|nr:hypothetical protein KIW84_013403 [Pisum sativum]